MNDYKDTNCAEKHTVIKMNKPQILGRTKIRRVDKYPRAQTCMPNTKTDENKNT